MFFFSNHARYSLADDFFHSIRMGNQFFDHLSLLVDVFVLQFSMRRRQRFLASVSNS